MVAFVFGSGSCLRNRRFFAFCPLALLLTPLALPPQPATVGARATGSRAFSGETIPIFMTGPSQMVPGGGSASVTISVGSVPSGGATIQVGTSHPTLVNSPSGSWPYLYNFPGGSSSTATLTFSTNQVGSVTSVETFSAELGVDMSVEANRRVSANWAISP